MHTKFLKASLGLCATLLTAVALLCSCTTELESETAAPGGKGEQEVRLKLQVPGASEGRAATRSVDQATEQSVKDLYILAFRTAGGDDDTFEYYVKARKGATDGQWNAMLKVKDYDQNFVVVANADGTRDNMLVAGINALQAGEKKSAVKGKLLVGLQADEETNGFNATGATDHSPFTMCGETETVRITAGSTENLAVTLYRIMARVQVYFGDKDGAGVQGFVAETVRLYNFNNLAQAVPDETRGAVTKPSIPQGAARCEGEARYDVKDNRMEYSAYLFETAQPDETDKDYYVHRPCLVIGGKYDGSQETTYYRVDFQQEGQPLMDILRNHSYEVTVKKVSDQGHKTEDDALRSKPADIMVTVVAWDETDLGGVDFDGENFLGIGTMEYRVEKAGERGLVQTVTSSANLKWEAVLLAENGKDTPDWISFGGGKTTITGGGGKTTTKEEVTFDVKEKETEGERTAIMRFKAGRLQIDAKVVQDDHTPVFLYLETEELVNIKNEDAVTTVVKVKYGPKNTELIWDLEQDRDLGIGLPEGTTVAGSDNGTAFENTKDIEVLTDKLIDDNKAFFTGKATMTLFARGKSGEVKKVTVNLRQRKLGVEFVKKVVYAMGQKEKVLVRSNFDWRATFDPSQQILKYTKGFTADHFDGVASETGNATDAYVEFEMNAREWEGSSGKDVVKFECTEDNNEYECEITMMDLFEYDNQYYEVLWGELTYRALTENERPNHVDGTPIGKDFNIIPEKMAEKLTSVNAAPEKETWTANYQLEQRVQNGKDIMTEVPSSNGKLTFQLNFSAPYVTNGNVSSCKNDIGYVLWEWNRTVSAAAPFYIKYKVYTTNHPVLLNVKWCACLPNGNQTCSSCNLQSSYAALGLFLNPNDKKDDLKLTWGPIEIEPVDMLSFQMLPTVWWDKTLASMHCPTHWTKHWDSNGRNGIIPNRLIGEWQGTVKKNAYFVKRVTP